VEKPVILVVEDNQTQQKVIALLAEEFGYKVILAGSGQEALEHARRPENQFTLVLMDIALPDFDGLICTQKLREVLPGPPIPVVAMSAFLADDLRDSCMAAGLDDYLEKPFSAKELQSMLTKWAARRDPV
jgi:CheY-like chemotaxis protein